MELYKKADLVKKIYGLDRALLTTSMLKTITGVKKMNTLLVILSDLVKAGVLERLERGKYSIPDKLPDTFSLANFLYNPSYLSLETALNFYGILSQFPYEVTSVTPKKKKEKEIGGRIFSYSHLKPSLFWGYKKVEEFLIAEPEKALLDQLYFVSRGLRGIHLDELDFEKVSERKVYFYAQKFPKTMQFLKAIRELRRFL